MPREIPSRWLARELMADNVEVALDPSEVGACLIDLAQVKRVLGSSAMPLACPLLVSVRLVMAYAWVHRGRGSAEGVASLQSERRPS